MSLIHWWPLNGNTNDLGISPCAVSGTPSFATNGKIGKCLSGGTLTMPAAATAQVFNKDAVSVCFWLYNGGSAGCIFGTEGMTAPNNRRFTLFQYPTTNDLHWSWQNEDSGGTFTSGVASGAIPSNAWTHICAVWDKGTARIYVNGVQVGTSTGTCTSTNWAYDTIIARPSSTRYYNDIRIYNHALSAKEVKEISKGLMLHYNFEDNCQQLVNAYDEPTFNTSATNGGWGHWGAAGHAGSYAQNTDTNYIYPGFSAYSHKVSNGSNATNDFLLYQEKLFDGGYRSMQAIIKASDGAAITNSVCYPAWNGRNGGVASGSWTSIESIGHGFYLCKVEGIKQTTSPSSKNAHLVGIYVKAGKTIYVTCCYLENGKQLCSDIFDPNPKCYDCSGYGYNGINNGVILSNDSILGKFSAQFASDAYIEIPSLPQFDKVTYSMWIKIPANAQAYRSIFIPKGNPTAGGIWLSVNTEGVNLWVYQGGNTPNYCKGDPARLNADTWYLYTHTFDGTTGQNYLNGVAVGSAATYTTRTYVPRGVYTLGDSYTGTSWNGTPFDGKIADFKIYATVLSAEDILAEYNRKAAIDKNGNLFTGEIIETAGSATKIDKNSFIGSNLFATTMTLEDGSVWAPICVHYVPDGLFTGSSNTFYYAGRNIWENFGAINDLERPESNQWEFYVMQQNAVDGAFSKYRFKQNVSPFSATWEQVNPSKVGTNVTRISSSRPNNYAGMYWYNNSNVAMCFANGSNGNWYGCGIRAAYQGGIPGYNGETVKGWQLVYMRISGHNARMFKNGVMIPTDIIEN